MRGIANDTDVQTVRIGKDHLQAVYPPVVEWGVISHVMSGISKDADTVNWPPGRARPEACSPEPISFPRSGKVPSEEK